MGNITIPGFLAEYEPLQKYLYEMAEGDSCFVSKETFDSLTVPLRWAIRETGLKLSRGKIVYKNNHPLCSFLFLPRKVFLYPTEDGKCQSEWIDLVIVEAAYQKKRQGYCVEVYKTIPEIMNYNLSGKCWVIGNGKIEIFDRLVKMYGYALMEYQVAYYPDSIFTWGVRCSGIGGQIYYATYLHRMNGRSKNTNMDKNLPLVLIPIESVFFSATLFSLCKPLYAHCKLKNVHYDFALQILLDDELSTHTRHVTWPYWALDCYADMWCNFREWENRKGTAEHLKTENTGVKFQPPILKKFRSRWTDIRATAIWQHLNFPLIYSDHRRIDYGDEIFSFYEFNGQNVPDFLSKKQLKRIISTSTLPILLPTVSPPKPYSQQECLTVSCDKTIIGAKKWIGEFYRVAEKAMARHELLLDFYMAVMRNLNGVNITQIRKPLLAAYRTALTRLGASKKEPSIEQQHKACLLGSMYFIQTYLSNEGGEYSRFESHIHCVERILGCEATLTDFANFVFLAMDKDSPYHSAILKIEEKIGIFLDMKKYWTIFQSYCKEKNIKLLCTELQFRKWELISGNYLKPQYEVADPNKYLRYDYRKVVDGKKRIVLNVDWKILKKAQKDNSF